MKSDFSTEINAAAMKLSVPVAVVAWGPQDWVFVLTGVYLVLQSLYLMWKWHRDWRDADE